VSAGYLCLDAAALPQPSADCQCPRTVDLRAEWGVHHHPPVAQLVAEALHHNRAVVGYVARGLALLAQIRLQVVGGPRVEADALDAAARRVGLGGAQLTDERAQRP